MYKNILTLCLCLVVTLCGCDRDEILEGKRENIEGITYAALETNELLKNTPVILQKPTSVKELTEIYGNAQHTFVNNSFSPTQKVKWRLSLKDNPIVSNILVFGNCVYTIDGDGTLYCLDKYSGNRIWSSKLVKQPRFGQFYGGITAHKSIIYITTNTLDVIAFDVATRKIVWKKTLNNIVKGAPVYVSGKLIVSTASNKTYALDANTGEILWEYATNNEQISVAMLGTPAVYKDNIICVYSNGDVVSLKLADGSVNWYEVLVPKYIVRSGGISLSHISASPVVVGDKVFVVNSFSTMSLFDAQSGIRIWSKDIGSMFQPAVVNKDWVFLLSDMDLLCISLKDGSIKWHVNDYANLVSESRKFKKCTWFGPLIVNNQVWIFSELGHTRKYDISTGKFLNQTSLRKVEYNDTPIIVDGTMYAQGWGKIYAIN